MADIAHGNEPPARTLGGNWGAIWVGLFTSVGIWTVFGMLGEAIFASAADGAPNPVGGGIRWGVGIGSVILTAIAMFVGGRVTCEISRPETHYAAVLQGQAMFGLALVAATIILLLGGPAASGGKGVNSSNYGVPILARLGWAGFVSLFAGWLAAIAGAASAVRVRRNRATDNVRESRAA